LIDRLNFFDLYAYLLPGLTWLLLVAAPYVAASGKPPAGDWLSAIAGVAVAYLLGHVLYQGTREAPWFSTPRAGRLDSQALLDAGRLSPEVKARVARRAYELWGLSLAQRDDDVRRQEIFELARAFLQAKRLPSYAEQMQGMQALSRGFAAALLLSAASLCGWLVLAIRLEWDATLAAWIGLPHLASQAFFWAGALGVAAFAWYERSLGQAQGDARGRWAWVVFLAVASAFAGDALAGRAAASVLGRGEIVAVAAAAVALAALFVRASRRFAEEFARHVYLALAATEDR